MNDKVMEALRELAAKFGQTVETLWPHAVRFVVFDGLAMALMGIFLIAGATVYWRRLNRKPLHDDDAQGVLRVILGIVFIIGVILVCAPLGQIIEPTGYLVTKLLAK